MDGWSSINLIRNQYYIVSFLFCLVFTSCEVINPEEEIPSWVGVEKINLITTATQGSNSQKISDVWVYVDDQPIGAFEMPSKFPILNSGTHKLTLKAGIKINGISASRGVYPFYEPIILNTNLVKDSLQYFNVATKYFNEVNFLWMENFENSGISLVKDQSSDTIICKTSNPDYLFKENNNINNSYAGLIELSDSKPKAKIVTSTSFEIPKKTVFLEFNYYCNQEFTVGYYSINQSLVTTSNPVLVLNSTNAWNKMYLNLTSGIARESAKEFKIFFEAQKSSSVSKPIILLDNIKLIYI